MALDPLSDYSYMCDVMNATCHDIATEVKYKYIRGQLKSIFPSMTLSRDEGRDRCNYDIMVNICDSAKKLSFRDFTKFVDVVETNNAFIAHKIRNKFQELSGRALPSENIPELPFPEVTNHFEQTPVLCQSDLQLSSFVSAQVPATRLENSGAIEEIRYRMDTSPRGRALIINNHRFLHLSPRKGSEKDLEMIVNMFKFLDFEITVKENQTSEEMKNSLSTFAKDSSLGSVSALAVVIMSHGHTNDTILGSDGDNNTEKRISKFDCQQCFTARNCPLMSGKPKLFIIQACRGNERDQLLASNSSSVASINSGFVTMDEASSDTREGQLQTDGPRVADTADMCFVHSSSLGYVAYRHPENGSPFIQVLTEKVMSHAQDTEFRDIIQKVQLHFSQTQLEEENMTMPDCNIKLVKSWYLMPPTEGARQHHS